MGLCFIGNSIMDNIVYQLSVKFVMKHTSDIVHEGMAHKMPVLADDISDYADDRNVYLHRPIVPRQDKEYNNVSEIFKDIVEYMSDLEQATCRAIEISKSEHDHMTKLFLDSFLRNLRPYTALALALEDYSEKNGTSSEQNMQMD